MPTDKHKKAEPVKSDKSLHQKQMRAIAAGYMIANNGDVDAALLELQSKENFREVPNKRHFLERWGERALEGVLDFAYKKRKGGPTRFPEIPNEEIASWFLETMEIDGELRHFLSVEEVSSSLHHLASDGKLSVSPKPWSSL